MKPTMQNLDSWFTYLYLQRRCCRSISLNNLSIFVNKELGEVPFDTLTKEATFLWFQKFIQRCSFLTIHINLEDTKKRSWIYIYVDFTLNRLP
jgi:hypothetical protein